MAHELLAATTGASASSAFRVRSGAENAGGAPPPVTFSCSGLAGVEYGTLQKSLDAGATWVDVYDGAASTPARCSATQNEIFIVAAGLFRINKAASVGSVGVFASTGENP